MEVINNPWFIGIGGGILSGLIVTFISRLVLSRRDNREYTQKVLGANREVIYAIKPGISEGHIPAGEIIQSLIEATARKYGVESKSLYRTPEIAQELMKEVMDSSFISAKTKEDYCARLATLVTPPSTQAPSPLVKPKDDRPSSGMEEYRARMISMMSVMMGMVAASMTLFMALSKNGPFSSLIFGSNLLAVIAPAISAMAVVIAAAVAMSVMKIQRKHLEERARAKREQISKARADAP
ncbi:hypothetical protein [Luteimonas deserti]|uniref:Uncharacterized protein n=1 Tax=Luteimonas deserti TaxID=2752306 RepID=A0A7Z0QRK7_9GAMM|nr:hypothetical protein [Luteimonas deserti]NYZ63418.1 hypothetical protein [Luteimonas deserti]